MIPIYEPWITDLEKKYVNEALNSGWVSSTGKFVDMFEEKIADFIGVKYAVTTCNGTTACHLALEASGLQSPDEVIIPNITFIATANAVRYSKLNLALCDIDHTDWNLHMGELESLIGPQTKAVFMVHLLGALSNMDEWIAFCKKHNLMFIEDACEAFGSTWKGKRAGSFGKTASFSFYGNKTITCGEGGMVVTNDKDVFERIKLLRGQGQTDRYFHPVIGYNYRMTNLCAALGLAQLERFDEIIAQKKRVFDRYRKNLEGQGQKIEFQRPKKDCSPSQWMFACLLPKHSNVQRVMEKLKSKGIETRGCFFPLNCLAPYVETKRSKFMSASDYLYSTLIMLPSYPTLEDERIDFVCQELLKEIEDEPQTGN